MAPPNGLLPSGNNPADIGIPADSPDQGDAITLPATGAPPSGGLTFPAGRWIPARSCKNTNMNET
eukprot:8628978-Pyramimonas_sp.AAC.1